MAIRADAVDVVCHRSLTTTYVIYESDIQAMRRIAIESGAHRVTELMDIYLKGGSWASEKEKKTKKMKI